MRAVETTLASVPVQRAQRDAESGQRSGLPVPAGPSFEAPRSRRDEIVDRAAEMFAKYGYRGASLRAISRHASISHPGMLHHFPTKEILLGAVIDRLEGRAQDVLDRTEEFRGHPRALLRGLSQTFDPADPSLQLLAMLSSDSVDSEHPGHFRMARLRRVYEHVFENCFLTMEKAHYLRPGIGAEFAARALMAQALALAVRELTVRSLQRREHDDEPIADLHRLARAFLVDGCSTEGVGDASDWRVHPVRDDGPCAAA